MTKVYKFSHEGKKVSFSHHSHPWLGKYTALTIGKKEMIVFSHISKPTIKKNFRKINFQYDRSMRGAK